MATGQPAEAQEIAEKTRLRFNKKHYAILIQGRMNRHGMNITINEAEQLLELYGKAYPLRQGLTPAGLRGCERIRSTYRREKWPVNIFKIRLMAYEDGLFIEPSKQKTPFLATSERMKKHWKQRKNAKAA